MEYKDIVEKALKGEDYQEDIKDFEPEKLKEVDLAIGKAAKAEADAELAKVTALRKEKQRLDTVPPEKKEDPVQNQLREENVHLAKEEFFANPKFKLSDEERVQFEAEFKKLDTGKIAPKLIIADLRKAFVSVKSEALLDSQDKMVEFEKNAAGFLADQAGGSGGQGSPDENKYSQGAKDLMKKWHSQGIKNKTLEDAQKLIDRGEGWQERSLAE